MPHQWTEEEWKQVQNRVRGGQGIPTKKSDGSTPSPSPSLLRWAPYKSKLEYNFAQRLELEKRAGVIDGWLYEPFSFMLASGRRYRVDFIAWKWKSISGKDFQYVTTCFEVKGWHRNYRAAMLQLSWAAQRFPFFQWRKVVSNGKQGFEVMEVRV